MSKYNNIHKKLKCSQCDEIVMVDQTTGSVLCWKCTMLATGGSGIVEHEAEKPEKKEE